MNYKVPGVYIEDDSQRIEPLKISKECLTGFLGVAEKGPVDKGVRIKSFNEFLEIFGGFTEYSYLAYSVYGYFLSGGKECIVVRVAHKNDNDESKFRCESFYYN